MPQTDQTYEKSYPIGSFRFLVEVLSDDGSTDPKIAGAFTQFSGIHMHLNEIKVRSGADPRGVKHTIAATTNYENVRLTKGVIGEYDFMEWILATTPDQLIAATGKNTRRTIIVKAINEKGDVLVEWSLLNAMPVAYELSPMDAMNSEVLTETVEFSISGFKRNTIKNTH